MLRAHLAELGPCLDDPATPELLIERYADTRSRILTAHFSAPCAGFIERDGKRFRFRFDPAILSAFRIAQPGPCGNMAASIPLAKAKIPKDQGHSPPVKSESPAQTRKSQIDALLLTLPGVTARKINGLDAYFVSDKMFACISGDGLGLRLPAAVATELQFSRDNIAAFSPGGVASTREWIQINRADATDYDKDLELFQASLDFVRAGRR